MLQITIPQATIHKSHSTIRPFEWFFDRLALFWMVIREHHFNYPSDRFAYLPELNDPQFIAYLAQQFEMLYGSN